MTTLVQANFEKMGGQAQSTGNKSKGVCRKWAMEERLGNLWTGRGGLTLGVGDFFFVRSNKSPDNERKHWMCS
jgi:hypothetical protein